MKNLLVVIALVAGIGAVLFACHANPGEVSTSLIQGAFGSPTAIMGTLRETTPLILCGVAVYLALQAGLFNIGVEGQFIVGALVAAVVGLRVQGPLGVTLALVAATLSGAMWAFLPGLIKAFRGGHEVITTIMLNNVAGFLTTSLAAGPFKDPTQQTPSTASLSDSTRLLAISVGGVKVSLGLVVGIALVLLLWWWLRGTVQGYELRAVGANPRAARVAGIDVTKVTVGAMLVSGAIAGLAGGIHVVAYEFRFYSDFSPGYGFNSLGVALLAGPQALYVAPCAFLFGMLTKGSASLGLLGIPRGISNVVLGSLIAIAAVYRFAKSREVDQS